MRTWKWIFVDVVVVIVVGLGLSNIGKAAELQQDQVSLIYALVYGVTHLPLPEHPPVVHTTSNAKLQEMACPSKPCPGIRGFQHDNNVYIDEALDMRDVRNAAILFHEFVHYYQWAQKGPAKSCREWVDREVFAYQAQNVVLNKAGAQMVQAPIMPTCYGEPEVQVPRKRSLRPEDSTGESGYYTQANR